MYTIEHIHDYSSIHVLDTNGEADDVELIFDENNEFVSITVKKGGATEGSMHEVDGISGGTITSDGVTDMIKERVSRYIPYLEQNKLVKNDSTIITNLISLLNE